MGAVTLETPPSLERFAMTLQINGFPTSPLYLLRPDAPLILDGNQFSELFQNDGVTETGIAYATEYGEIRIRPAPDLSLGCWATQIATAKAVLIGYQHGPIPLAEVTP
jgi:hypothetical protein